MANSTLLRTALIIAETQEDPRISYLSDRLEAIGFSPRPLAAQAVVEEQVRDASVLLLLADDPPRALRMTPVPIMVLSADALYAMGMALAEPTVDFGLADVDMAYMNPQLQGHPLLAGVSGAQTLSRHPRVSGWGVPGKSAIVVATVSSSTNHSVIFAYDIGMPMATMRAAHRRAAFLPSIGDESTTEISWRLFSASVMWLYGGGGTEHTAKLSSQGRWVFDDGSPTRLLSVSEYRDWVRDQIQSGLFKQLSAVVGGIGLTVGGLFLTYLALTLTSTVNKSVSEEISKVKTSVHDQLTTDLGVINKTMDRELATIPTLVGATVVTTLMDQPTIRTELTTMAAAAVKDNVAHEIETLFIKPDFNNVLVHKFREAMSDSRRDIKVRVAALQLSAVFAPERLEYQNDLIDLIVNEPINNDELRQVALSQYAPGQSETDKATNLATLRRVLLYMVPRTREELRFTHDHYVSFLSRFARTDAAELASWLGSHYDSEAADTVAAALYAKNVNEGIDDLANLLNTPFEGPRAIAWKHLEQLEKQRPIPTSARREALKSVWMSIAVYPSDNPPKPAVSAALRANVTRLFEAIASDDMSQVLDLRQEATGLHNDRLQRLYQSIVNRAFRQAGASERVLGLQSLLPGVRSSDDLLALLAPNDDTLYAPAVESLFRPDERDWDEFISPELFARAIFPVAASGGPLDVQKAEDIFLFNWVGRLKGEHTPLPPAELARLLERVYNLPTCLCRAGCAAAINYALDNGPPECAARFLDDFVERYRNCESTTRDTIGVPTLLTVAFAADAREGKSLATYRLLAEVVNSPRLSDRLMADVVSACGTQLGDAKIRETLYVLFDHYAPDASKGDLVQSIIETIGAIKEPDAVIEALTRLVGAYKQRVGNSGGASGKDIGDSSDSSRETVTSINSAIKTLVGRYCVDDTMTLDGLNMVQGLVTQTANAAKSDSAEMRSKITEGFRRFGESASSKANWVDAIAAVSNELDNGGPTIDRFKRLALAHENARNYKEAGLVYTRALKMPDDAMKSEGLGSDSERFKLLVKRGNLYHNRLREYGLAILDWEAAITLKETPWLHTNLSLSYSFSEDPNAYARAKKEAEVALVLSKEQREDGAAIEDGSEQAQYYALLGDLHKRFGQYMEAVKSYNTAIKLAEKGGSNTFVASFHVQLGHLYFDKLRDNEGALASYLKAVTLNDREAIYQAWTGDTLRLLRRYDKAIERLERAMDLEVDQNTALFSHWKGLAIREVQGSVEATASFERGVQSKADTVFQLRSRASCFSEMRKYDGAEEAIEQAMKADSKDVSTLCVRAALEITLGKYTEAMTDCEAAVKYDSRDADGFHYRGVSRMMMQQYAEAEQDFTSAIEINPNDEVLYRLRGDTKRLQSRVSDAVEDYSLAASKALRPQAAYIARGRALDALDKHDAGKDDYRRARDISPVGFSEITERADALIHLGEFREATDDCRKVIDKWPENVEAHAYLGFAFFKLGQHDDAVRELDEAIAIFPRSSIARFYRYQVRKELGDRPGSDEDLMVAAQRGFPEAAFIVKAIADKK